jgi:hypothetical protein
MEMKGRCPMKNGNIDQRMGLACSFAILFALTGIARADDTLVANPVYQSWAKFKPGTTVEYSTETNMMGNATSMEITQTLKEVNADKATIEVKMSLLVAGSKTEMPAATREIPVLMKPVDPAATQTSDVPETETATESVQAAGKMYSCKKTTVTSDATGMITKSITWTRDDMPGTIVKTVAETAGSGMTMSSKMILTDFEPK